MYVLMKKTRQIIHKLSLIPLIIWSTEFRSLLPDGSRFLELFWRVKETSYSRIETYLGSFLRGKCPHHITNRCSTVKTLNIGTPRPATVVVLKFYFRMK